MPSSVWCKTTRYFIFGVLEFWGTCADLVVCWQRVAELEAHEDFHIPILARSSRGIEMHLRDRAIRRDSNFTRYTTAPRASAGKAARQK
jgi:hypothetical protein